MAELRGIFYKQLRTGWIQGKVHKWINELGSIRKNLTLGVIPFAKFGLHKLYQQKHL